MLTFFSSRAFSRQTRINMKDRIHAIVSESIRVKQAALDKNLEPVAKAAHAIIACYQKGGKVLLCGNGGSAADSQHIAAEFIGRFQKERRALPAKDNGGTLKRPASRNIISMQIPCQLFNKVFGEINREYPGHPALLSP